MDRQGLKLRLPVMAVDRLPIAWETIEPYMKTGCILHIETTANGAPLKKPVAVRVKPIRCLRNLDILNYILVSLSARTPMKLPWVLENESMWKLAAYLRRYKSSSTESLVVYTNHIYWFCRWVGKTPDQLLHSDPKWLKEVLQEYVGELQARGRAPMTITVAISSVKTLLRANGVKPPEVLTPRIRVVYEDRAPRPEELQRMIDVADLRGKVIVSMLALGGFRIGTLSKLRYYHVKDDLERGVIPVHIHVEAEITKGKYGDYDTFIGAEAVHYLKLYLDQRRRGTEKIPPEEITDDSPLIRAYTKKPKPLTPRTLSMVVGSLYARAGLVRKSGKKRYTLRPHSIRKFFRTQLAALGVPSDYIEYMMGHRISTYHDIKMKGVEFLRRIYAQADLRIRPKEKADIYDFIEDILRSRGYLVDRDLLKRAIKHPHRTVWSEEERRKTIRETFLGDARREFNYLPAAEENLLRKPRLSYKRPTR